MLDTGHENVHRNVCRATKEVDEAFSVFLREQALLSAGQDSQTPRTALFIAGEIEETEN